MLTRLHTGLNQGTSIETQECPRIPPDGGKRYFDGSETAAIARRLSRVECCGQARLIALACSEPPKGHARWSIRLLADKVVELEIVEAAHFNTVGRALKKTTSNRI